jgi:hypothetical protein
MSIFDLYSQSQQAAPARLIYDRFPKELKVQCIHTWTEFFSQDRIPMNELGNIRLEMAKTITMEHALSGFPGTLYQSNLLDKINIYFESLSEVNKSLDIVQIVCFYMENLENYLQSQGHYWALAIRGQTAIDEINERFKRHGIGYQYSYGKIVKLDNQLLHSEAVDRTFQLLADPGYANVSEEYQTAHEHFRFGRNADTLSWSLKAFESVMKVVADQNGWAYAAGATAKPLIDLLFANHFFPPFSQTAMTGIRSFLESSIPTIRNKKGGHGSGSVVNQVPDSLAQYMLYITGSTINWIVEIQAERRGR